MRSLFFLIFYSSIIFPCGGEHEFYSVLLIDARCRRVVVDGHDVLVFKQLLQGTHRALARDVVGQAAEGLRADDVLRSRLGERRHLGGDEPALPHLHPLVHDEICALPQMFEVVHGLEAAVLLREADELSLLCEQPAIGKRKERRRRAPSAVELGVVQIIDDAVQDEVHERRHDGLAPFGKQEIFEVRIA